MLLALLLLPSRDHGPLRRRYVCSEPAALIALTIKTTLQQQQHKTPTAQDTNSEALRSQHENPPADPPATTIYGNVDVSRTAGSVDTLCVNSLFCDKQGVFLTPSSIGGIAQPISTPYKMIR